MFYRLMVIPMALLLLLTACTQPLAPDQYRAKFAVVVIAENIGDRTEVEDKLSTKLQNHGFNAVASHPLVSGRFRVQDSSFRKRLISQDIVAVLALRPIEVGPDASIKSVEDYVQTDAYSTIEEFVAGYRGDDFTTNVVVEVGGFLLTQEETVKLWQGVVWLDGEVPDRAAGIDQLTELILANMQKWRPQLRESVGLAPLH